MKNKDWMFFHQNLDRAITSLMILKISFPCAKEMVEIIGIEDWIERLKEWQSLSGVKFEAMRKRNFNSLVLSYVAVKENSTMLMVEEVLRKLAKRWGGCISCVFSRKDKAKYSCEGKWEGWTDRVCSLGLFLGSCGKYLSFPERRDEEEWMNAR